MKIYVGPKGMRSESNTNMPGRSGTVSITVLSLADKPDKLYMINEANGSCMEMDVSKGSYMELDVPKVKQKQEAPDDPYLDAKIEKLGKEEVNGYNCNHVRLSWPNRDNVVELWMSKDILDYFTYAKMQGSKERDNAQLAKKLKAAGLDGFPVKTVLSPEGVVTELVKAERTKLDASLFEVPSNCSKMEIPSIHDMPEGMAPEKMKKMEEWGRKMMPQR